ncbi:hypothetical protein GCM10010967_36220 [Dyadobacter beijingensis]|uniref:Lipoprotein n=1 Tax=Dyadobacter beijingensis TaxID=365489 RepID=A0ABQ2I716_9BACT|nr:hypothetical protein [Dyadobacter beijingensis]GGM99004.1 hypothetical protein GCM10010967_36220 [Dyadobacter beijingensis]
MKKNLFVRLPLFGMTLLLSCSGDVEPTVASQYLRPDGTREEQRRQALRELYQFYSTSDKSKVYYEVLAKRNGRFILNYYPTGELLTYCTDPGSGWSGQVTNVSTAQLQRLASLKLLLDSLKGFVQKDSVLKHSQPFIQVRTNGSPSL